jgi:putative addiction module killer protein
MPTLREYVDEHGWSPYGQWFDRLSPQAAAKVTTALTRLSVGNTSSVGKGVHEVRIDFGPGFRVYVGMDSAARVILLGGSAKARQSTAIADAQACWADYRRRKHKGER